MRAYSNEPVDGRAFTQGLNRVYGRSARAYDWAVVHLPVWKTWLQQALPHIQGSDVLEVSFGTGYLLTQYAARHRVVGIDYNHTMVNTANANLRKCGINAPLLQSDATALPFHDNAFDCVVNTMAFSGYPDGARTMAEFYRVLRPKGRLVLLDIGYAEQATFIGDAMVNAWKLSGDLIRDMGPLFENAGFTFTRQPVGGFGSVHLFIAERTV